MTAEKVEFSAPPGIARFSGALRASECPKCTGQTYLRVPALALSDPLRILARIGLDLRQAFDRKCCTAFPMGGK